MSTDPTAAAATTAGLKEAAYFIKLSQAIFGALYAVCIWDWLVSLQREYRLIWKARWSIVKVLYLLCRYWVLLSTPYVLWVFTQDHSRAACWKLFRSPIDISMWNQLWAEGVLLFRAYVFLGNRLSVLIPLSVSLAGVAVFQLWLTHTQMSLLPFIDPAGGPCFPTVTYKGSPMNMLFWVIPFGWDAIVTVLTVWRALQIRNQGDGNDSPLLRICVAEGILYFLLISAANLCNAVFYMQPKHDMSALLVPLSIMFPDVLACRMILGLREHASRLGQTSGHSISPHNVRKPSDANQLDMHLVGSAGGKLRTGSKRSNDSEVATNALIHELTTFSQNRAANSKSVVGRNVKTVPYEVEEGVGDDGKGRNRIRVDIESHMYYEEGSDGESDHKKGKSLTS